MCAMTVACFDFTTCIFAADCLQQSGLVLGSRLKAIPSDGFGRRMAMFVAGGVGGFIWSS